ncbi:oxidoreductase [Frondihabitans sp. PAMC 28766]|uniref:SDR family oxidoreductase n=1 Tax=Frondihabitans sp. PAMC 28766 TaxID=1795630 RepID=UPI00078DF013|nr:SDR family oxidoreductase [Frondihabitans sp. PAMC 28766]AMM20955.1 oxidoreductase [Frondihabitans sp. PAMC 28766]
MSTDGIDGKVVAITGASSGIGESIAILLASKGAKVVLGARREEKLDDLEGRIRDAGGDAASIVTDVRRRTDVQALVDLAQERFGRLDVLVSNAGIGPISPLDALAVDEWEDMVDINVKGLLWGISAALPVFRAQKAGHFVNILSTAGIKIVPTMAVYAATKNAGRTITEGLRQESGADLRVTGISPGMIDTGFTDTISNPETRAALADQMAMAIPPEAIARAALYAIEQPANVDVGDIVIRSTAQG